MKKIISFTTIPSRIEHIKPMLDSILNQSLKPDQIILWVGKSYDRLNHNAPIKIPNFIVQSNIIVNYCEDVGPFSKLYHTLKQEWENKETIIVTADDDVFYPPHWFKNLIRQAKRSPNKAIGYRGRILKDKLNYKNSLKVTGASRFRPNPVDIITGTWGALYKVKFFDMDIFDLEMIKANFMVDDIWITGHLAKNNIKRIVIRNVGVKLFQEIHEIDGLWHENKKNNNNNKMLAHFKGFI